MKTLLTYFILGLLMSSCVAQDDGIDKYLSLKPVDIILNSTEDQVYEVTMKWQNLDAIKGNKYNCNLTKATFTVEKGNKTVNWSNVGVASIHDFHQKEFSLNRIPSFDGFSYKVNDTGFLKESFYNKIAPEQRDLAKWLVSDAIQMQGLAWYVFDSLSFKKEFQPELLKSYNIKFEDWATFSSRYQKLEWTGITQHNKEICAIIKFESLYNPVRIENEQMQLKGRSLYYGEMWISLSDKQVEYAIMIEDVVMKLRSSLFPDEQLIDLQREIVFDKKMVVD